MFLAFGNNKQIATVANAPSQVDEREEVILKNPSAQRVQRSNRYSPSLRAQAKQSIKSLGSYNVFSVWKQQNRLLQSLMLLRR